MPNTPKPLGQGTLCDYISLAISLAIAVVAWLDSQFSMPIAVILTVAAALAVTTTPYPLNPLHLALCWYGQRTDDLVYKEAVRAYRALAIAHDSERADLEDRVRHLRTVVCIINHWDENTEVDTGGLADQRILAWWQKCHPKDYALR